MIRKKIYDKFRNMSNIFCVNINRFIYGKRFCVGRNLYVRKNFSVVIEDDGKVDIGSNVFFNNFCSINSLCGISIGDDCIFGENVHLYDHNHNYTNAIIPINSQGFSKEKITIGKNCWIGSNVTILKGVTIGDHVIVGANCLIFKDIPDHSIVKCEQKNIINIINSYVV